MANFPWGEFDSVIQDAESRGLPLNTDAEIKKYIKDRLLRQEIEEEVGGVSDKLFEYDELFDLIKDGQRLSDTPEGIAHTIERDGSIILNADEFLEPTVSSISSSGALRASHLGGGTVMLEDGEQRILLGAGYSDMLTSMGKVAHGIGDSSGHDVTAFNSLAEIDKLLEDVHFQLELRSGGQVTAEHRLQSMAEKDLTVWKDAALSGEAKEGHTVDILEQNNLLKLREMLLRDKSAAEERLAKLKDPLENVTHVLLPSTNLQDAGSLHRVFTANPDVKIFVDPDSVPAAMQSLGGRKTAIAKTIDLVKENGGKIISMVNKEVINTGRFEILPVMVSKDRSMIYGFVVRHISTNSRMLYLPASQDREAVQYMLSQGPIDAMWLDASNDGVILSGVVPPGYTEKFNRYLRIEEEIFDDLVSAVEKTHTSPRYAELMNVGDNITSRWRAEELAARLDPSGQWTKVQISYPGKAVSNPVFVAHAPPTTEKSSINMAGTATNLESEKIIETRLENAAAARLRGMVSPEEEGEAFALAQAKLGQLAKDSVEEFDVDSFSKTSEAEVLRGMGIPEDAGEVIDIEAVGGSFSDFIDLHTTDIRDFSDKRAVQRKVLDVFNIDLFKTDIDVDRLVTDQVYFDEVFKSAIPKGHTNRISARVELRDLWQRFNWDRLRQSEIFDPFEILQVDLMAADFPIEERLAHQWAFVYNRLFETDKAIMEAVHAKDIKGVSAINTGGPNSRQKLVAALSKRIMENNRSIDKLFKDQYLNKFLFMSGIVSEDIADDAVGKLLENEQKFIELLRNEDPIVFKSDSAARIAYAKLRSARDAKIVNNTVGIWLKESQGLINEVIGKRRPKLLKPSNVAAWVDVRTLFSDKLVTEARMSLNLFESSVYKYVNRAKQLTLIEDVKDMFDEVRRISLLKDKARGLLQEIGKQADLTTEYSIILLKDLNSTIGLLSDANFVYLGRAPKYSDYSSKIAQAESSLRKVIYQEFNKITGRGGLFLPGATANDTNRAKGLFSIFENWRKNFHRDAISEGARHEIGSIFDEFHRLKLREFGVRLEKEKSPLVLNEAVNFFAERLGFVPTEAQADVLSSLRSVTDLQQDAKTPEERRIVALLRNRYENWARKYPVVSAEEVDTTVLKPEVERFVELRKQKELLLAKLRLKQAEIRGMPKRISTLMVNLQQEAHGSVSAAVDPDELDALTAGDQRLRALRNRRLELNNEIADIRVQISKIEAESLKYRLAHADAYASASDVIQNIGRNKHIPIHIREDMEGVLLRLDNINIERAKLFNGYNEILRLRGQFEQTLSIAEKQKIHREMLRVFDDLLPMSDANVYIERIAPYIMRRLQADELDIGGLERHMTILETAIHEKLKDIDTELDKANSIRKRVFTFAGSKVRVPAFQVLRDIYRGDVARISLRHYMLLPQDVLRINMVELPKLWNSGLGGAAQGIHIDLMRKYGFNYTPGNTTSAYLFPIRDISDKLVYKLNISKNMSPEVINNLILHAEQIALSNGVDKLVVEMPADIARRAGNFTEEAHGFLLKYLRSSQNPLSGEHFGVGNNGLFKYRTFSSMASIKKEVSNIISKVKNVQMASPADIYKIAAYAEPAVEIIGTPDQYLIFKGELSEYLNGRGVGGTSTASVDEMSKQFLDEVAQAMAHRVDAESRIHAPMSRVWGRNGEFPLLVYVDNADNIKVINLGIKIAPGKADIYTDVVLRSGKGFLPSDGKYSLIIARSERGQYIVTGAAGKLPESVPFQAIQHTINFLISNDARGEYFDGVTRVEHDMVKAQTEMERRIRNLQIDPDELAGFMHEEEKLRTRYVIDIEEAFGDRILLNNAEEAFNEAISTLYHNKMYAPDGSVRTKWMKLAEIRSQYLGIKNKYIFGIKSHEDGIITTLNKYAGGFGATVYFDQGIPTSQVSSRYIEERLTQLRNQLSTNPARTAEISEEMARLRAIKTLTINPETRIAVISPQLSYEQDMLIYQNIINNDMPAAVLAKDEARINRLNYILEILENNMAREDRMRKMFRLVDDDTVTMSHLVDVRGRFLLEDRLAELRGLKRKKQLTLETEKELKDLEQAFNYVYSLKYRRNRVISDINRETQLIADGMPFADWFKLRWEVINRMVKSYVGRGADSIGRVLPRAKDIYHNIVGTDANFVGMYEELDVIKDELENLKKDIRFQESEYKRKLTDSGLKPLLKEIDQLTDKLRVIDDSISGFDAQYWQGPIRVGKVADDAQSIIDHLIVKKLPVKSNQSVEVVSLLNEYIEELTKEFMEIAETDRVRADIILEEIDSVTNLKDNIVSVNKLNETFTSQRLGMPSLIVQRKGIETRMVTLGSELRARYPQEVGIQLSHISLLKSRQQTLLDRKSSIESRIEAIPPDIRDRFGRLYDIKFGPLSRIDKLQNELEVLTIKSKTLSVQADIDDAEKRILGIRAEISGIQGQMVKDTADIRRLELELRREVNIYDDMAVVNTEYFAQRRAAAIEELENIKNVITKKRSAGENVTKELVRKIDIERRVKVLDAGAKSVGSMQDRLDFARLKAAKEHNKLRDHLSYPQALRNEQWQAEYRRLEASVAKLYNEVYELENVLSVVDSAHAVHALKRDSKQFIKILSNLISTFTKGAGANIHEARQRQIDLGAMKYANAMLQQRVARMSEVRQQYNLTREHLPVGWEKALRSLYDEMIMLGDFSTINTFLHPNTIIEYEKAMAHRLPGSALATADILADPSKAHIRRLAEEAIRVEFLAKDVIKYIEDTGVKLSDVERSSVVDRVSAILSVHNKRFSDTVWAQARYERMLGEGLNVTTLVDSLDELYDRMASLESFIKISGKLEAEELHKALPEILEEITPEIGATLHRLREVERDISISEYEYNKIRKIVGVIEKIKIDTKKRSLQEVVSAVLDENFKDIDVLEYLNLHAIDKVLKEEAKILSTVSEEFKGFPIPRMASTKYFDVFRASMYALDPMVILPKHVMYYQIVDRILGESNAAASPEDIAKIAKELNKVFEGWGIDILSMYKLPGSLKGEGLQYELVQVLVNDRYFMTKLAKAATKANFVVDRSALEIANAISSYTKKLWPAKAFPGIINMLDSTVASTMRELLHGEISLPAVTYKIGLTNLEREELRQLENKSLLSTLSTTELSRYEDLKAWDKVKKRIHVAEEERVNLKLYLLDDSRIAVVRSGTTYEKIWGPQDKELRVLKVLNQPLNKRDRGAYLDFHTVSSEISRLRSAKEADNRLIAANIYEILLADRGIIIKPEHRGDLHAILANYRDDILKLRPPKFDPSNIPKTLITKKGDLVQGILREYKDWVRPDRLLDEINGWQIPYDNFKTFLQNQGINWKIFGDSPEWFERYQKQIVAYHKIMEQIREKDSLLFNFEADILAQIANNRAIPIGANPKGIATYMVGLVERRTQALRDMLMIDRKAIERVIVKKVDIVPRDTPELAITRAKEVHAALTEDLHNQRKHLINLNRPFKQQVVSRVDRTAGLAEDATKLLQLSADQLAIIDRLEYVFRQFKIMRTPGTWRSKYGDEAVELLGKLDAISGTGYAKYINSQYHNMIRVHGMDWDVDELLGIWWKENKGFIPKELVKDIEVLMKSNMRGSERAGELFKILDGQVSNWTVHMRATADVQMQAHYAGKIRELTEVINSRVVGGRWYKETMRHFYELIPALELTGPSELALLNKVQDVQPPVKEIRELLDNLTKWFADKPNKLVAIEEMKIAFEEMQLSTRGMVWSIIDTISIMTNQAVPDDETLSRGRLKLTAYTDVKPEELEARFGHKIYRMPDFETEVRFPTTVSEDKDAIVARLFAGIKEREKLLARLPAGELEYTDKQVMDLVETLGKLELRKLGIKYKKDVDTYLAVEQILSQYHFDPQSDDAAQKMRTILNRAVKKNELSRDEVRKYYKVRGYIHLGKITPEDLVEYETLLPIYQRQIQLAHIRMQISRDMAELHAIRSLGSYTVIDELKKDIKAIESQIDMVGNYADAIRTYNGSIRSKEIFKEGVTYRTKKQLLRQLANTNEDNTRYAIMNDARRKALNDILLDVNNRARQYYTGPEEKYVPIINRAIQDKIFEAVNIEVGPPELPFVGPVKELVGDSEVRLVMQDDAAIRLRATLFTDEEKRAFDVGFSIYRDYFNESLVVANYGRRINAISRTLETQANDLWQKLSSTIVKEDVLPPAHWDAIKQTRRVLDKWYQSMHFNIQATQTKASTILNAVARDLNIGSGYEISAWIRKYGKLGIKLGEAAIGLDSLSNNLKKMARGIKYSAKDAVADQVKLFFGSEALRAFHGFKGMVHTLTYWTHKKNAEMTYYMFRNMGRELDTFVPWSTGEEMAAGKALKGIQDLGKTWYESGYGKRGNALYDALEQSINVANKEAKRRLSQGVHPILVGQQMMSDINNAYIDARQGGENLIGDAGIDSANRVMDGAYMDNAAIISKIEYKAVNDSRTCSFCRSNDGVMYNPADNRPPLPRHPNCRCWYRQWLKTPEEITPTLEHEIKERKKKSDVWLDVDPDALGGMGAGLRKLRRPLRSDGTISDDDWLDWYHKQPYDIRKRMVGEENALAAALGIYGDNEPVNKHKFVRYAAMGIMGDLVRRTGYRTSAHLAYSIFRDSSVRTNILRAVQDKKNASKYIKAIPWKALLSGPDNLVQPALKRGFSDAVGLMASSNPSNPGELEMLINRYVSPQIFNVATRVLDSKYIPPWLKKFTGPVRDIMEKWGKNEIDTPTAYKELLNINKPKNQALSIGFMRLVEPWAQMISEVYWPSLNMHQIKIEQAAEEAIKMAEMGPVEGVIQSVARSFKNSGVMDMDAEAAIKRFVDSLPLGEKESLTDLLNILNREGVPSNTQRDIIEIRGILRGSRGKSVKEILDTPEIKDKFLSLSQQERHLLADTIENVERRTALLEFGELASEPSGGELLSTLVVRDPLGSTTKGGIATRYVIGPDGKIYSDNKDMVLSASRLVNPAYNDSDMVRISISRMGDDEGYVISLLTKSFEMNNRNSVVSGLRDIIYRAGGGSKTTGWVDELIKNGAIVLRKNNLGPHTEISNAALKYVDTALDNIINMSIRQLKAKGVAINPADDTLKAEIFQYIVSNMRSWVNGLPPSFRQNVANNIRFRLYSYGTTGMPSKSMLDRISIILGQNM